MRNVGWIAPLLLIACSTTTHVIDDSANSTSADVAFHAEAPVLPDFSYDTGLQPSSGPAQLSLKLTSTGSIVVDAAATKSGDKLQGKAGAGKLKLDMHVKFDGQLKVDAGVTKYDGPFPGLKDLDIPIAGDTAFDGFSIDGDPAHVAANLPETKLPDIPLGSVPGHLSLTVLGGSTVTTSYQGSCVQVQGGQATLHGHTVTSGKLLMKAQIVLDIPLYSKSIDLPQFSVDLPKSDKPLDSGAAAAQGVADASCTPAASTDPGTSGQADGGAPEAGGGGTNDGGRNDAGTVGGDTACGATTTYNDCVSCCATNHTAGYNVYADIFTSCACTTPGECKTQCSTSFCSDGNSSTSDCDTCMSNSSCKASSRASCTQGGGDCAAFLGCLDGQACKAKP
jgi:hypothetical protein